MSQDDDARTDAHPDGAESVGEDFPGTIRALSMLDGDVLPHPEHKSGQSLGATFNPTRGQVSIDALNGTGVLLVSDRQQTDPQGGGTIGQLQGFTLDFQGATVGTYVWSSSVQWLDEQSKPHYGEVDLAVTITN